jgi:hypothetical protein
LEVRTPLDLGSAEVVVDEDAVGIRVPLLRHDFALGIGLLHDARLDPGLGSLTVLFAQSNVDGGLHGDDAPSFVRERSLASRCNPRASADAARARGA